VDTGEVYNYLYQDDKIKITPNLNSNSFAALGRWGGRWAGRLAGWLAGWLAG
jgi:hypothetical protein